MYVVFQTKMSVHINPVVVIVMLYAIIPLARLCVPASLASKATALDVKVIRLYY